MCISGKQSEGQLQQYPEHDRKQAGLYIHGSLWCHLPWDVTTVIHCDVNITTNIGLSLINNLYESWILEIKTLLLLLL